VRTAALAQLAQQAGLEKKEDFTFARFELFLSV
jgi:hypothetical protein